MTVSFSVANTVLPPKRLGFSQQLSASKLTQSSGRISVQFSPNNQGTHHYILVMFWILEFSNKYRNISTVQNGLVNVEKIGAYQSIDNST